MPSKGPDETFKLIRMTLAYTSRMVKVIYVLELDVTCLFHEYLIYVKHGETHSEKTRGAINRSLARESISILRGYPLRYPEVPTG